jgi:FixJ family two-component response regulator
VTEPKIVVLDEDEERRRHWESSARAVGLGFRSLATLPQPSETIRHGVRILIMPDCVALADAIARAQIVFPHAHVIVCGRDSAQMSAVEAFRSGADDFVEPGVDEGESLSVLSRHLPQLKRSVADEADCGLGSDGSLPAAPRCC